MTVPTLELDDRWFEVLARSDRAVITRHRIHGTFQIWRLEWDGGPGGDFGTFEAEAWAKYLELQAG